MRPAGSQPPADAIVIREGKRKTPDKVVNEAQSDRLDREEEGTWNGEYHLSVFAGLVEPGETQAEAAARLFGTHRRARHFRVSTPAALLDAGFDLQASPPEPYHYDCPVGPAIDEAVVAAFDDCFGEPIRNQTTWQ